MSSLSKKEMEMVSWLELENKRFFTRDDIKKFFKNNNLMKFYISVLKKKKRIVKISKYKYYLVPIQAYKGQWSEHPYLAIDEMFDGQNYYIGGISAANYWGLNEQIPVQIDVYCTNKQGIQNIFNARIRFKRQRKINKRNYTIVKIKNHSVNIATKKESGRWKS